MGATVVITGRNIERLQETYNQLEGLGHKQIVSDLTLQEDVEKLIELSPQIDGLVNNAGIAINKPIMFYNQSDLTKLFQINTFAPMLVTKALLKKKKIKLGGSIVITSSISAFTASGIGNGMYGASKAAITSYMKYCAFELGTKRIRVNAVHPGMVETDLIHGGALSEDDLKKDVGNYPLRRYGKAEEIAYAIIYLLSEAASWITGSSLIIDGGYSLS